MDQTISPIFSFGFFRFPHLLAKTFLRGRLLLRMPHFLVPSFEKALSQTPVVFCMQNNASLFIWRSRSRKIVKSTKIKFDQRVTSKARPNFHLRFSITLNWAQIVFWLTSVGSMNTYFHRKLNPQSCGVLSISKYTSISAFLLAWIQTKLLVLQAERTKAVSAMDNKRFPFLVSTNAWVDLDTEKSVSVVGKIQLKLLQS